MATVCILISQIRNDWVCDGLIYLVTLIHAGGELHFALMHKQLNLTERNKLLTVSVTIPDK